MTAIFAIAIIVFLIARSKEQTLTLQRRNQKFGYYLLVAFNDFLRMFLVVMVLYHALLLFVLFSDRVSTGSLVKLEDGLARIESYCKMFKLRSQYAFLVLLAVYAFGLARFVPAFTKYRDRAKKVYQFAALLCCFTLLGSQVGPPALTLAVQIRHNRHEFGVLRDSVRAAVAERVTGLVVQRIANGFPTPFPRDVNSIATVDRDIHSLRDNYDEIKRVGGDSKGLRLFLRRYPPPASELEKGEPSKNAERSEESTDADGKAEDVAAKSYEEIKAGQEEVRKLGEESGPESVGLDARKRLTLELFKSGREGLKSLLLDSYIKELPILGPIHDILASALDKSAKDFIDRKADAIASSMPKEQNALDTSLSEAAREVSRSINVDVNPRTRARYNRPIGEWRAETKTVASLKARAPMEVLRAQTPTAREPSHKAAQLDRLSPRPKTAPIHDESDRLETFRRGVDSGWIVTRNSRVDPNKLFVHRTSDYRGLVDLKYYVREEPSGETWTVYSPGGRRIGTIPRPPGVPVGECNCQ